MIHNLLLVVFAFLACLGAVGVVVRRVVWQKLLSAIVLLIGLSGLVWLGVLQLLLDSVESSVASVGGIEGLLFWVFAISACGGAIAVVATQNVVRMAFWLVVSLGSVAALFFLMHADFLGAAQLLIYVGGTVVLLVFGVMLTASGPTVQIKTSPAEAFLGAGVGMLLLFVLMFSIGGVSWRDLESKLPVRHLSPAVVDSQKARTLESDASDLAYSTASEAQATSIAHIQAGRTVRSLGLSFFGLRPDQDLNRPAGRPLAPGFLLPFEIVSIHLLVVLVGAAYLARAKRKVVPTSQTDLG